jgi:ubiquinone/menaquinone biosynthesis C-methylase UbiE
MLKHTNHSQILFHNRQVLIQGWEQMTEPKQDIWSEWLLKRRFGDDPKQVKAVIDTLLPIRDCVLSHANLGKKQILLDIGDGLIAFGALEANNSCHVIFSDVSQALLDRAQQVAEEKALLNRCQFVCNSATNLLDIADHSIDAVTTRSVLIYISDKQKAFREFYRVLKPEGRISMFEPIVRFSYHEPKHTFWGYDVTSIVDLSEKVKGVYREAQPPDTDPMLDFDERNLITYAKEAGFKEIYLELQVKVKPKCNTPPWNTVFNTAPNPKAPSLAQAVDQVLTPAERKSFISQLRPLLEREKGIDHSAVAYLWATKI